MPPICMWIALLFYVLGYAAVSGLSLAATKQGAQMDMLPKLEKRQWVLQNAKYALIEYQCPIAGEQIRRFVWRAKYNRFQDSLTLEGLQNIDTWTHIDRVTNNYMSTWDHRYARAYFGICCLYIIRGTVYGTIYDRSLETDLSSIRVSEICVEIIHENCPTKTFLLVGVHSQCRITHASVWRHV